MSSNDKNSDGTNSKTQSASLESDGTLGSSNDSGHASSISPSDSSASPANSLPPRGNPSNFGGMNVIKILNFSPITFSTKNCWRLWPTNKSWGIFDFHQ